jgi:ABC-type lipoprotein release transport system permease subunit
MGPGETIAAIVLGGIVIGVLILIGSIFQRFMKFKERQLGLTADATAEKAAQYASHVRQLEERVRVLERIATDKGADLAHQIENLRREATPRPSRPEEELN